MRSKCLVKIPGDLIVRVVSPLPMLRIRSIRVVPLPSGCPEATPTEGGKNALAPPITLTDESGVFQLMDGGRWVFEGGGGNVIYACACV